MPRVLFFLLVLAVGGWGLAGPSSAAAQSPPGAQTRSDTVAFSPTGTVELDNRMGSITVRTWDRPNVGYEITLAPSEGDSVLATDFDIDRSQDEFSVGHDHSWTINIPGLLTISPDGGTEPIGHFQIMMPKTASLDIEDYESTIEVSGLEGPANIDTYDGTIRVRSATGKLQLETYSGTATATGIRGEAELETYSGRMTAVVEEMSAPIAADAYSGLLRFFLPADAGFTLVTDADPNDLTIDEAFEQTSRDEERWNFNGGGPELSVETFSGPVELRPLDAYPPPADTTAEP